MVHGTRALIRVMVWLVILSTLEGCGMVTVPTPGLVRVDRWAEIKADDKDVAALLAAFNRTEEALHTKDLIGIMALYSEQYRYHGLSKSDLRKAWEEIFAHYDNLGSAHIFSAIRVRVTGKTPTAEITCSGHLWGVTKETGHRDIIDSWYSEIHHLVYENGEWRIIGHAGGDTKALPFGTSPHPFF